MPTYDYHCTKCDHHWELFHSIKAEPVKTCPACGEETAKRQIGPGAGIIFKGTGFYQTDYRSDSYSKAAAADKKASESPSSESKSSESKSAESKPTAPPASSSE
ncbi:MAG: zinc ribbon domain-containing protein [Planctomycetaceae bacterium]